MSLGERGGIWKFLIKQSTGPFGHNSACNKEDFPKQGELCGGLQAELAQRVWGMLLNALNYMTFLVPSNPETHLG